MSSSTENTPVDAPKVDTTPAPAPQSNGVSFSISFGAAQFVNIIMALVGAGLVLAAFSFLQYVGSLFAASVPFIFGGILFCTLVSAFFMLLRAQKQMRLSAGLRVSFAEAYTGVAIFTVMGYFATACMHAFLADGLAAHLWTQGVTASALAVTFFGLSKGAVSLWNEGKKS